MRQEEEEEEEDEYGDKRMGGEGTGGEEGGGDVALTEWYGVNVADGSSRAESQRSRTLEPC